ncbi:hypothetical protein BC830DRAFT_1171237 [Chytriomyces sp. MP71]|nr:hypothetical protein BC830DRAFT_1171237 [Chytriomyces sp. MP71]
MSSKSIPVAQRSTKCALWYSVHIGETCFDVANTVGIALDSLEALNPGIDYNVIYPNQSLCVFNVTTTLATPHVSLDNMQSQSEKRFTTTVQSSGPHCNVSYIVQEGDSCLEVALAFNRTVKHLEASSGLDCMKDYLHPGQVFEIPTDVDMIYVFVVDTSASMNQVFSHGLSYLDVTKSGIEHFFKAGVKAVLSSASLHWEQWRSDRKQNKYVLIDYSDPPFCLKAGINDTIPSLLNELKSLSATDMSNPGQAFHAAFEYINAYRFQAGLETLGKGRYLNNIEPTLFLWFTDGGNFSVVDRGGSGRCFVNNKLQIPGLKTPGAFAYFEPFRWDQRMHTFLLHPEGKAVHPEVAAMSNASNGDVYAIWSKDHMKRCIENAMGTQKPPHPDVFPQSATATFSSITLQMEELSETSVEPRRVFRLNVFPQADQNTFPLPEQYWVSRELNSPVELLFGNAEFPILSYLATNLSHSIPINFPYDRFSIDQQHWGELLRLAAEKARHTTAGLCWTIYAKNSGRTPGLGEPIGFFKITTNVAKGNVVMMYLLPYNFPRLFRIIDRLNKNPEMKQSLPSTIINEFRAYLAECPPYYHAKLRLVLGRLGLERLMPDSLAQDMSAWPISSFLATTCDQAKVEFGKFNSAVSDKNRIKSEEQRRLAITTAQVVTPEILVENAFDVSRARILSELKQLQSQFNLVGLTDGVDKTAKKTIQKLVRNQDLEDALHSVPISEMTNHNAKPFVAPLRSPFESDDELVEMAKRDPFGNPWAVHKTMRAAGSYAGSDGSSGGDEVANEASLLQAGDKAVDDAKREADLVNASLHARRPRKLGGKVFMDGASARGSSLAGDSEMTRVTVGTVTSRATSIFDRMPSIVAGFPVLVVPPSAVSFGDIVTGRVDLSEWTEKARKEAQDNQEAADKAEAVILDQEKALLSAAAVRNWNLPPPSNPLTSPVTSIIPVPNTPDLVTSSRNQASSLDKSRTAHMPLLAQFLAKGQMATHEPTSTHHQDANEVLPPSSNSQALSSKIALQDPTPLDNDFDMLIDKHLNGASTPVGKIQQANSLKRKDS